LRESPVKSKTAGFTSSVVLYNTTELVIFDFTWLWRENHPKILLG